MRNFKRPTQMAPGYPVTGVPDGVPLGVTMTWTPAGVTMGAISYNVTEQPFTYGTVPVRLMRAGRA